MNSNNKFCQFYIYLKASYKNLYLQPGIRFTQTCLVNIYLDIMPGWRNW